MSGIIRMRSVGVLAFVAAMCAVGCVSEREIMLEARGAHSTVLETAAILQHAEPAEGQDYSYGQVAQTPAQSVYVLGLASDAVLEARYHEGHDLTIVCLAGSAIVEIEGERTFLEAPACVVVPRLHSYKILPHKSEAEFVALLVYSPPYDGDDLKLLTK